MATTEFKVFHGVGAVIAQVTSHTRFSVLAIIDDRVNVDFSATGRLFEVDLNATPNAVGLNKGSWSDVKFDDRGVDKSGQTWPTLLNVASLHLGITSLGAVGDDLTVGAFVGAVYIEHHHYNEIYKAAFALPGHPNPWPGSFYTHYQITSIAYSKDKVNGSRAGRRYHGFQGHVTEIADGGKMIKVEFPRPTPVPPLGATWFRVDDPSECDNDPPSIALGGARSITTDPTVGKQGAFFVALPHAVTVGLSGPKLPIGEEF